MSQTASEATGSISRQGPLRKVKPKLRQKYFVLHRDQREVPARLEYYDSVKQWEARKKAKKTIYLNTCFSVNRYSNNKVKDGLVLFTKDDSFAISCASEEEREAWLLSIRALYMVHRDARPFFEHCWSVKIRERGLGRGYEGEYRLCLKDRNVMFFKKTAVEATLGFPLEVVRHVGHTDNFFKLEVGRQASTGAGEFWLEVDDELIASNVHQTLIAVMNAPKDEDSFRPKSSSQSSTDRRSFSSKSGTLTGTRERTRNGQSSKSKSNRNRSDSVDSKSTLSTLQPSQSVSSIPPASLRSVENVGAASAASTLEPVAADSRGSTPVRPLTPDVKTPRSTVEVGLATSAPQPYMAMDMSSLPPNQRANSISSSSVHSWTSAKDHLHIDTPHSASADTSFADMTSQVPLTSQAVDARLSVGKKPGRAQSYLSPSEEQFQPTVELSAAVLEDTSYFDMVPAATKGNAATDPHIGMLVGPSINDIAADPYMDMMPGEVLPDLLVEPPRSTTAVEAVADPYMDMAPSGKLAADSSDSYFEMAPASKAAADSSDSYFEMTPASKAAADSSDSYFEMAPASKAAGDSSDSYFEMAPAGKAAADSSDSYFEMAPASKAAADSSDSYFEMAPASKAAADSSDSYFEMAPASKAAADSSDSYFEIAPAASDPYMDMTPVSASKDSLHVGITPFSGTSPSSINSGYLDMTGGNGKGRQLMADTGYMTMNSTGTTENRNSLQLAPATENKHPYIDMSGRDAHGFLEDGLKMDDTVLPLRHYSVGSRPVAMQKKTADKDQYVEMCRSKEMSAKSQSVPHLMPLSLASNPDLTHLQDEYPSNYPSKPETLMMMNFDRQRTFSESHKQRPRGATWSANIRPHTSSFGQKHKLGTKSNSSRESIHSTCSDYIDMQIGNRARENEYVEMSGRSSRHNRKHSHPMDPSNQSLASKLLSKISPPRAMRGAGNSQSSSSLTSSAKSNSFDVLSERNSQGNYVLGDSVGFLPEDLSKSASMKGRRSSQPLQHIDPFPGLSNSSEEEAGMRSTASSFSSTRSTSSSRSSLARSDNSSLKNSVMYGGGAQLEPESYVECQPVTMRSNSHSISNKQLKPARVASFISEEPTEPYKAKLDRKEKRDRSKRTEHRRSNVEVNFDQGGGTYVEMTPTTITPKPQVAAQTQGQPLPKPPQAIRTYQPAKSKPNAARQLPHVACEPKPLQALNQPASSHSDSSHSKPHHTHTFELPKPPPLTQSLPISNLQSVGSCDYAEVGRLAVGMKPPIGDLTSFSKDDPYCVMEVKSNPEPDSLDNKLMVDISDTVTTISTNTIPNTTSTGTGSSGDSNHTLQQEDPLVEEPRGPLAHPQFSVYTKNSKTPKPVPCYIRQNSTDINIYPSPEKPTPCYIRSESVISTNSEFEMPDPMGDNTQDDILDSLANTQLEDVSVILKRDGNDPLSPIRLVTSSNEHGMSTPSYSRSNSDSSDIPSSAAELDRQQRKKLELVQEESGGSKEGSADSGSKDGSTSSTKDLSGQVPVKSYIRDEKPVGRTRSKPPTNLPPSIPMRTTSVEEKPARLSSGIESTELAPLVYVDIKHEVPNPPASANASVSSSSSPKSAEIGAVTCLLSSQPPHVIYTTIDHEKTQELSRKGPSTSH